MSEETNKIADGSDKLNELVGQISACPWDDGDWVIAFGNCPIGGCISRNEAKAIERWLKNNITSLVNYLSNENHQPEQA